MYKYWHHDCPQVTLLTRGACCAGAEGNTYLVQDVNLDQQLAIKLIKLPLPTRFVQAIFRCSRVPYTR